jgi:hypothetical protein
LRNTEREQDTASAKKGRNRDYYRRHHRLSHTPLLIDGELQWLFLHAKKAFACCLKIKNQSGVYKKNQQGAAKLYRRI